jgi:hypothetical protein
MPAAKPRRAPKKRRLSPLRLDKRLVLFRFLLQQFGVDSFEDLVKHLKDSDAELLDEDNVSQFHHLLAAHFPHTNQGGRAALTADDLRRYDDNIVSHTGAISARRGETIRWKYFQYLALLFTEIYLDRFFDDADALLDQLNRFVSTLNADALRDGPVDSYKPSDLRSLAFWMATGSGKTLLMHVNILQFRHYLARHGRQGEINRTILVTPNEGLSRQHQDEFDRSGLDAELFAKDGSSVFAGHFIEILDIHKLAEASGEKTIAVDAFERNNLVLVDEGHRGAGGVNWKEKRDRLAADGFSFEYSATFGQAIKAANDEDLAQEYARAILFDYSYRFFYADGYGKDYQILNLADDATDTEHLYLIAALLSFYQQLRVYEEQRAALKPYNLERPLWVFVGGSVTQKLGKAEGTDIQRILGFLSRFVQQRDESIGLLNRLLSGDTGLVAYGRDVFAGKFGYVFQTGIAGDRLFADILRRLFNAETNAPLRIEELKGADGELALRLGTAEPFGVINIGDAHGLAKLLENDDRFHVVESEFAPSVFARLAEPESRVDLLIGSKKFTEGWNSFRVSSLGLMNVGKSEGSQIIQLFGRGVRLRGRDGTLKRSRHLVGDQPPDALRYLETLSVYGLHADYMTQFKQFLEEEGLPVNDNVEEIVLPVDKFLPDAPLKTIRLRDDLSFQRDGPLVTLELPTPRFPQQPIPLDYTPKLQVMVSQGLAGADPTAVDQDARLLPEHVAFLNLDALYFALVRYKEERSWSNLTVQRHIVGQILADDGWYSLTAPKAALSFDGPEPLRRIPIWQEIALSLLKKYVERFYKHAREKFEAPLRMYAPLQENDPNFIPEYQIAAPSDSPFLSHLRKIKDELVAGTFTGCEFGNLNALAWDRHLYKPLLYLGSKDIEIKPVPLNEGERDFVIDLRSYYASNLAFFADKELYLLRNLSSGKGVGFFEAGNFYPDFILWLLIGDRQYITFIDPKGIRQLGPNDTKILFSQTIKDIEAQLGDPDVILDSYIVSGTRRRALASWGLSDQQFRDRHVLFRLDDPTTYIETMLQMILTNNTSVPAVAGAGDVD